MTMVDRPNVLLVSVDSLRPDYCSFANDAETTTPFLDELAEHAAVYERAISPSTWTLQVHGSIFTGLYPIEHQVFDKGDALGEVPTLAEQLGREGYATESFGRNGWLESGEILRGFDHHRTPHSIHIRNELRTAAEGISERDPSTAYEGSRRAVAAAVEKVRRQLFRPDLIDAKTIDRTIDGLDAVDDPFCFFVHMNGVHYPFRPPAPYHRAYGDHSFERLRRNLSYQRALIDNRPQVYAGNFPIDAEQVQIIQDLYRGCIRQADDLLRRLVTHLDRTDRLQETVIVIFGDHGDHLGDDGHFGHQFSVDDVLLRVPLLVYDPTGTVPSGRTDSLAQLNDLYPTLLDLAGVEAPETQSRHLVKENREAAYTYYVAPDSVVERFARMDGVSRAELPPTRQYAVWQSPDRKLVWYPEENRYNGPAATDEALRDLLAGHMDSLEPVATREDDDVSRTVEQNLRDMGYL